MERSKFGPFFTREVTFSQASHVISFSHYISEQKKMSIIPVAHIFSNTGNATISAHQYYWNQMKAYANEFKKEIYSYKKRSVNGKKISVTYKKFSGKRLSAVQIHQSNHFHWDSSSSQSEWPCPCVHKFPIQFPKHGMNLSIRLESCIHFGCGTSTSNLAKAAKTMKRIPPLRYLLHWFHHSHHGFA